MICIVLQTYTYTIIMCAHAINLLLSKACCIATLHQARYHHSRQCLLRHKNVGFSGNWILDGFEQQLLSRGGARGGTQGAHEHSHRSLSKLLKGLCLARNLQKWFTATAVLRPARPPAMLQLGHKRSKPIAPQFAQSPEKVPPVAVPALTSPSAGTLGSRPSRTLSHSAKQRCQLCN